MNDEFELRLDNLGRVPFMDRDPEFSQTFKDPRIRGRVATADAPPQISTDFRQRAHPRAAASHQVSTDAGTIQEHVQS